MDFVWNVWSFFVTQRNNNNTKSAHHNKKYNSVMTYKNIYFYNVCLLEMMAWICILLC